MPMRPTPAAVTLTTLAVAAALACSAGTASAATPDLEVRPTAARTASPTASPGTASSPAPTRTTTSTADTTASGDPSDDPTDRSASSDDPAQSEQPQSDGPWLSGASGDGAADGSLGDWRGAPVEIVGTWADQGDNQTELYSIAPGGEVADWTGPIDIAPGGLLDGDTWAAAADGAYDDRWRESLTRMAELRADDDTTYVRPFHEFNLGGAYPWAVTPDQADDFTTAWKRYRAIQQDVFPGAQLVYGVNVTSSGTDLDWRTTWPGAGEADVLGVDTYNGWPTITSTEQFAKQLDATGEDGIPVGLNAYAEQAKEWGVPLAVPEWSGRAEMGDEPAYVEGMTDWFAEHAGDEPGQLAYEVLFNAPQDDGNFQLYADDTRMPESAEAYREASQTASQDSAEQDEQQDREPSPTSTPSPSRSASSSPDEEPSPTASARPTDADDQAEEDEADGDSAATSADVDELLGRLDDLLARLEQG